MKRMSGALKRLTIALLAASVCLFAIGAQPSPPQEVHGRYLIDHDYRPSVSLTRTGWLSDYNPALLGSPGDSKVYYFDGGRPGGALFVGGGTHANEIAGIMAAVVMLENLVIEAGRVIVVPNLNNSAVSHQDKEPSMPAYTTRGPSWIGIDTASGRRYFKSGSRATNAAHQGLPDPADGYVHPDSREAPLAAWEFRNLNRAYPGRTDSGLTQGIAYAVMRLLNEEKVAVAFDYHEADVGGRLANMLVAHPKNIGTAASALLDLDLDYGLSLKLEPSNMEFRGLSHREWGSGSGAMSFLTETPNPGMSHDAMADVDVVDDPANPLASRVATHIAATVAVVNAFNGANPSRSIVFSGLPSYDDLREKGLGRFLK
ncbi:MAG: hypothetical protein Q8M76_02505 [Spirochaetaceae bacterium]|nr:hypothetical protein [Spirochaetaceae bacterium]